MSVGQELGKEFWKDIIEKERCAPSWRKAQWGTDSLRELSRAKMLRKEVVCLIVNSENIKEAK